MNFSAFMRVSYAVAYEVLKKFCAVFICTAWAFQKVQVQG